MSNVKDLTNPIHDQHVYEVDDERVVVLDFYASWCGPCKAVAPQYEALASKRDADFYKIDSDKESDLAFEYGVKSLPTFVVIQGGQIQGQSRGSNLTALVTLLDDLGVGERE